MTSKTISVGGEVGSNGLRFSVSVSTPGWTHIGARARYVKVLAGGLIVYQADWSEQSRTAAIEALAAMLATSEPDLCKYLTRALMEVEL